MNVPYLPSVLDHGWRGVAPVTLFSVTWLRDTCDQGHLRYGDNQHLTDLDGLGMILFVHLVSS